MNTDKHAYFVAGRRRRLGFRSALATLIGLQKAVANDKKLMISEPFVARVFRSRVEPSRPVI